MTTYRAEIKLEALRDYGDRLAVETDFVVSGSFSDREIIEERGQRRRENGGRDFSGVDGLRPARASAPWDEAMWRALAASIAKARHLMPELAVPDNETGIGSQPCPSCGVPVGEHGNGEADSPDPRVCLDQLAGTR